MPLHNKRNKPLSGSGKAEKKVWKDAKLTLISHLTGKKERKWAENVVNTMYRQTFLAVLEVFK